MVNKLKKKIIATVGPNSMNDLSAVIQNFWGAELQNIFLLDNKYLWISQVDSFSSATVFALDLN